MEVAVAGALLAFALTALYVLYMNTLNQARAASFNAAAGQVVMQRMDQMKSVNWLKVTDGAYIKTILSSTTSFTAVNTQHLPEVTQEQIVVSTLAVPFMSPAPSPTPTPSVSGSLIVTRTGTAAPVASP